MLAIPVFVHTMENGKVYVANYNYGTVSVINTTTNVVVANVGVDPTQVSSQPVGASGCTGRTARCYENLFSEPGQWIGDQH